MTIWAPGTQARFMHEFYFPRPAWAMLTLLPTKFYCLQSVMDVVGHRVTATGLRPNVAKLEKIEKLSHHPPKTVEELNAYLYFTNHLRSGSARNSQVGSYLGGFEWGPKQQSAYERINKSIIDTRCRGGDPTSQYHLACDASLTGIGGVLFQLPSLPAGTVSTKKTRGKEIYPTTEREGRRRSGSETDEDKSIWEEWLAHETLGPVVMCPLSGGDDAEWRSIIIRTLAVGWQAGP
ncbi:hypothetical protein TWF481_002730 [Arthrobotrys musiformis]|uniref:Reverse transcriptase/retrotransposon-derived protein RNase H-like domain-containing protein n=1 Tax=Arthrobotrys musiformis TaxID=47236 RepID=A0AAV9VTZ0_9PEZI